MKDKFIECKFCGFEGEFEYEWTANSFLVICPSCRKVNYEVDRGKIDALARDIVSESVESVRNSET